MLNRPRDPDRQIQLRRNRLPRAPHLPLHRQPARIADRPRRRQLRSQRRRQLLHQLQILLLPNPSSHAHNHCCRRKIHRLRRLTERLTRFRPNLPGLHLRSKRLHLARACRDRIGAKASRLHRHKAHAALISMPILRVQLPLQPLPPKNGTSHRPTLRIRDPYRRHIANQHLAQPRRQRRRIIPHLVCMRKHHIPRLRLRNQLLQSRNPTICRVLREQRIAHSPHRIQPLRRQLRSQRRNRSTLAHHRSRTANTQLRRQLLPCSQRLKTHPVPTRALRLRHHQHIAVHIHSTSKASPPCAQHLIAPSPQTAAAPPASPRPHPPTPSASPSASPSSVATPSPPHPRACPPPPPAPRASPSAALA